VYHDSEFHAIVNNPTSYNGDPNATVISMWFADTLDQNFGFYGVTSLIDLRVIAIGWDAVFSQTRLDTIAHEIGHSLGLPHTEDNSPDNLMTAGFARIAPKNIDDITPDGLGLDQLNPGQSSKALRSPFAGGASPIPEPGTLLLVGIGLVGLGAAYRWRDRA
jgi:hypothetical protein